MKVTRIALLLIFPLYLISCGTQQKLPNYVEKISDSTGKGEVQIPVLRIQKSDILSIQIYSTAARQEVDAFYNPASAGSSSGAGQSSGAAPIGYLVDTKGNIEIPRVGIFHAEGLTKEELAAQIKERLTKPIELLKDPSVLIRYANMKIVVLGEVANQGVMSIPGEKVTILEAVGLAGGITDYGMKDRVRVYREVDGQRQTGLVNLASDSLFLSPYYNLMQNDVVIVEPAKKKAKMQDQNIAMQRIAFGLSVITAITLIYSIFQ